MLTRDFRPSDLFVAARLPTFALYTYTESYTCYRTLLDQTDSHPH